MEVSSKAAEPDGLPRFDDRSRWFWPALIGLAVAVLIGVWISRPLYHRVKLWRATKLVATGNAALAANDLPATSRAARAALGLAPDDPGVLRLAARYATRNQLPDAVNYWELLVQSGAATMEDRQEFARFAQSMERFDLSERLIDELLAQDNDNRTNRLLRLDQNALLGNWPLVVRGSEVMLEQKPGDPYLQFMLAQAYLHAGEPSLGAQAAGLLRGLAATNGPQQFPALRTLAAMYGPPPEELRRIADQLDGQTNAPLADRLLAWEVRERLAPEQRAALQERAFAGLPRDLGPADTVVAADWFRARQRTDLARKLLPASRVRDDPALWLAHCQLLADERRWSELGSILDQPRSPLNPVASASLRALLAHGTGQPDEAARHLRAAVRAAGNVGQLLQVVAGFAEQIEPAIALEAWTAMLENPLTVVPAAVQLLRRARSREDLTIEHLVYQHLIVPLGKQPEVRFQNAYLRVLFNEQLKSAHDELARLAAKDLHDIRLRCALALAKLRLGQNKEALTLCETGDIVWDRQEPRWRAIYAAALEANQEHRAARKLAETIPLARLKLEERLLIHDILEAP